MLSARARPSLPLLALLAGCPRTPPREPPVPPRAVFVPADVSEPDDDTDAALPELALRDPALAGPLAACRARLQRALPRELGAALAAMEYPDIDDDACRLELAVTMRAPALCARITLGMLRERCEWRSAVLTGEPERCPTSRIDRGRDPLCVALTARAPGLCGSVPAGERALCVALMHHRREDCAPLDPLARLRCQTEVDTLAPLLPALPQRSVLGPGTFTLAVRPLGADAAVLSQYTVDVASRGAYLDTAGVLYLVDPMRGWPMPLAFEPLADRPVVGLALPVPLHSGPGGVEDFRVVFPDGRALEPLATLAPSTARWDEVGRTRAAHVRGTATLRATLSGQPVEVLVRFDTFVRDVVSQRVLRDPPGTTAPDSGLDEPADADPQGLGASVP